MYICRMYKVDNKLFLYHTFLADTGNGDFAELLQHWQNDLGDGDDGIGSSSNAPAHFDKLTVGPKDPVCSDVASSSQPELVLQVQGDMTVSGTVRAQQVLALSDERAKCNIRATHHDALSILRALKIYQYQFNSSPEGRKVLGPLAQEVANLIPDAVETDCNGDKRVDFTSLNCLTVQGVQQLGAQCAQMQVCQQDTGKCLGFVLLMLGSLAEQLESTAGANSLDRRAIGSPPVSAPCRHVCRGPATTQASTTDSSVMQDDKTPALQQPAVTTDPSAASACNSHPSKESRALPVFKDKDAMVRHILDALNETNDGIHQMVLNRFCDFGDQSVWDSFQEALLHGDKGKREFINLLKKKQQILKTRSATPPSIPMSPNSLVGQFHQLCAMLC